jgi:ATP-binding cassette subfamily C (CFTR/MRP) protein 1
VLLVGIAVATRSRVGSAQMGVALLNVVSLGESMKSLVKHWTTMETSIAAVARIQDFVETTLQESPSQHGSTGSRPEIDANGGMALTLTNVSAKYS